MKEAIKVDYAIITPLPEEAEYFYEKFNNLKYQIVHIHSFEFKIYEYQNKKILLTHSSFGIAFAAITLTLIHDNFQPDYVLICGTAGGIKENVKIGDVIIATLAFAAEMREIFTTVKNTPFAGCLMHPLKNEFCPIAYSADPELIALSHTLKISNITIHEGIVVSSDNFPAPVALITQIREQDAYAIDMETSSFYQAAWLFGIKAIAIRGISNILNPDGTDDKLHLADIKSSSDAAGEVTMCLLDQLIKPKQTLQFSFLTNDENI